MMSLGEAAGVLGATVRGADVRFTGVSTDTRTLAHGDLFVALRGDRFDGNAFLEAARAKGAVAAIVQGDPAETENAPFPTLLVGDTRAALGRLAGHWRRRFELKLVAVTGSSGKTTVKEMLAAILRTAAGEAAAAGPGHRAVLATRGNLNNEIGVPLTLLELTASVDYAVVEMGMSHAGEISYLSQLAAPDVAVITNAGSAHIEFLGSTEAIARAKGEIYEGLKPEGTAVLNADDAYASLWRELAGARRRIEFGVDQPAQVSATYESGALSSEIVLETPTGAAKATLRAPGVHNVRNALAAAAAAVALEVAPGAIAAGLERYPGVKGRLQLKRTAKGATLIDDTYNANPESMRAAIAVLAHSAGRRLLVLGDMGELGTHGPELHAELGAVAREAGIDRLYTFGEHSALSTRTFGSGAKHYEEIGALIAEIGDELGPDVTVLVKGSRFMKMERVVEAFAVEEAQCS
jgi:UDP-N-acetylmuramoyl-tripeptide--D-alanyl-D-alanine ligase